jgi:hypothetical protein
LGPLIDLYTHLAGGCLRWVIQVNPDVFRGSLCLSQDLLDLYRGSSGLPTSFAEALFLL